MRNEDEYEHNLPRGLVDYSLYRHHCGRTRLALLVSAKAPNQITSVSPISVLEASSVSGHDDNYFSWIECLAAYILNLWERDDL